MKELSDLILREAKLEDSDDCIILLKQLGYHLELDEFQAKLELCQNNPNYKIFVIYSNKKLLHWLLLIKPEEMD